MSDSTASFIMLFITASFFIFFYLEIKIKHYLKIRKFNNMHKKAIDDLDFEWLYDNDYSNFKTIDCTDEMIDAVTLAVGSEKRLKTMDKFCVNYAVFYSFDHKKTIHNNKDLSANNIQIQFRQIQYKSLPPLVVMCTEVHFGEPYWTGREMIYNYNIERHFKILRNEDLKQAVLELKDKYYTMERPEGQQMNYITAKKFRDYGYGDRIQ